jgi:hypothetical protein
VAGSSGHENEPSNYIIDEAYLGQQSESSLSGSVCRAVLSHMLLCVHVTTDDRCTQSIFCETLLSNNLATLRCSLN